jgi:uncharacterized protein YjbI with pentapeptide repeats
MNYQGRLLDNNGVPVTGSYNFTVRIYDDPAVGLLKYEELHAGVQVNDGVYSFKIGSFAPTGTGAGDSQWDIALWQTNLNDLYLEVQVGAEILSPRQELTSAPHAFTATLALAADQLGTKTSADFDNILEGLCDAGSSKWLEVIERCATEDYDFSSSTWSDFTASNDFSSLSFKGASFAGADFSGVNFSRTDFSGLVDFSGANLAGANFSYATGSINVAGADLTGANFSNSDINLRVQTNPATFSSVNLYNVDMGISTDIQLDLSAATYNRTKLSIISLDFNPPTCPVLPGGWSCKSDQPIFPPGQAGGSNAVFVFGPNIKFTHLKTTDPFTGEDLSSAYLVDADIDATFDQTNLSNTLFSKATISKSDFITNNLTSARFPYTTISWTNFYQSTMDHQWAQAEGFYDATIDHCTFEEMSFNEGYFHSAIITNTVFRKINNTYGPYINNWYAMVLYGAKMDNVRFVDSDLSRSSFRYAHMMNSAFQDITGAGNFDFRDSVIDNTVFENIDLTGAQFDNAKVQDVTFSNLDMTGADFTGASLENITWGEYVTCPDGTVGTTPPLDCIAGGHM